MDKRQLVDGCKRGDSASVEALYRSYSGKLMGICRHYVDSQEVAEDLLHDAFIVILSSIGQLKNPDKLDSWMGVIVKNMAIDYLKESQHFTHPQEDLDMEDVPDEPMYPVPPYEDLMALIDRLPEQYGKVFRLSVLEGLSHKEIGALLHIGEKSSSSNLFRARQVLQKELKQYWLALLALIVLIVTPLLLHKETEPTSIPDGPIVVNNGADSVEVVIPVDSLSVPATPTRMERIRTAEAGPLDTTPEPADTVTLRQRLMPIDIRYPGKEHPSGSRIGRKPPLASHYWPMPGAPKRRISWGFCHPSRHSRVLLRVSALLSWAPVFWPMPLPLSWHRIQR